MRHLLLFLVTLPAAALNNSVTIHEATGSVQTGRPMSVARWFARGEIANYPAPYLLGGAAITPWQADVKTRWDDGSAQFAIVSFRRDLTATGSVSVEFRNAAAASSTPGNAGLTPAQLLTFNGGAWGAKISTTTSGVTQSADARVMLGALASAPDQLRCWLCGPVVTQMIVEDRSTALAYDWGYQGSPIDVAVTANATTDTLTKTAHGLVNGNQIWFGLDSNIGGTLPGGITAGTKYYVVGATANTFQVSTTQNGSAVDLTSAGAGSGIRALQLYSNSTWTAADAAHKSLHPIFVITAYAGWPGVRVEHILENTWIDKAQDQWFDTLTLYSGSTGVTTAATVSGFAHASRSRWRKLCWDGTAPAGEPLCGTDTAVVTPRPKGILVDYNFPYMVYSGAVLPLDTTRTNVAFRMTQVWGWWTGSAETYSDLTKGDPFAGASPGTIQNSGALHRVQYQTGVDGWGLIGLYPTPQALHWYIMGDGAQTMTTRMRAAEVAIDANYAQAHWSTHYREGGAARKYLSAYDQAGQTTSAFGLPVSTDARTSFTTVLAQSSWTNAADRLTIVGPVRQGSVGVINPSADTVNGLGGRRISGVYNECSSFMDDEAHSWMPIWNSYLLLGDWYAMEELQFWGAWYVTQGGNPGLDYQNYGRHASWGTAITPANPRIAAWHMRGIGYALAATPTEDAALAPMRTYFASKLRVSIFAMEGQADVRAGLFQKRYPAFSNWSCAGWNNSAMTLPGMAFDDPQTAWCWGRVNAAKSRPNPLHFRHWQPNYVGLAAFIDTTKSADTTDLWHEMYLEHVTEYLARLGIADAESYAAATQRPFWLDGVRPARGYLFSAYNHPVTDASGNPFTTWDAWLNAFMPGFSTMTSWCTGSVSTTPPGCGDFPATVQHSYMHMFRAAVALSESGTSNTGYTGTSAYDWMAGNVTWQHRYGTAGVNDSQVDPRFAFVPQWIRNVQVSPGSRQAVIRWSASSGDACKVGVSAAAFSSTDSSGDAPATMSGRSGSYVADGLTPGIVHHYRITCGPNGGTARATGKFVTVAEGSSTTLYIRLRPPASLPAASAYVEHGATPGLGSSTAPQSCSTTCVAGIPATGGVAVYYRVRYLSAAGAPLPTGGGVQALLVP